MTWTWCHFLLIPTLWDFPFIIQMLCFFGQWAASGPGVKLVKNIFAKVLEMGWRREHPRVWLLDSQTAIREYVWLFLYSTVHKKEKKYKWAQSFKLYHRENMGILKSRRVFSRGLRWGCQPAWKARLPSWTSLSSYFQGPPTRGSASQPGFLGARGKIRVH